MRVFVGIALFLFVVMGQAQSRGQAQSQSDAAKIYAVVFDITVDPAGKLQALKVIKVIYPNSGTTDAVNVVVPDSFISAARVLLLKRSYPVRPDHRPDHAFTYFFYDPSQPTRADVGPRAEHT